MENRNQNQKQNQTETRREAAKSRRAHSGAAAM